METSRNQTARVSRSRPDATTRVFESGAPPPQRILLVEDHQPTRDALENLLVRDGHQVLTAPTVADAIVVVQGREVDLLISDLGLPDGSGNEIMGALRLSRGMKGIAITGHNSETDRQQSKAAGFLAHAAKPVNFTLLRQLIAEAASSPAAVPARPPSSAL